MSLIREEQDGLSQDESTKTSAELNLVCGSKSPSWPLLNLALETINAPPALQLPSLEHSICPSPRGEKDRHRDKDRNDLASPRNPSLEKVTGPPRLPGQDLGLSLDTA